MTISIRAIANADDCLVVWRAPTVPGCLGYQLERESTHKGVTTIAVLDNRLGWAGDPSQPFEHQPSSRWPFRRYAWTDFQAPLDSSLRYRVTPVFDRAGSNFVDNGRQSSWSNAVTQSGEAGDCAVYFNRGIALSQFMARELKGDYSPTALRGFKDNLAHTENRLRKFLGGDILRELIRLLDTAINDETIELYAALYELTDEQLIGKLETLGARAHVVLSNGSSKSAPDDENESARERLKAADVEVHDRMLYSKGLGHNKFVVVTKGGVATKVWTGSANWMRTGLCTQMNNALIVADAAVATAYRVQWERLRDAGSEVTVDLKQSNSVAKKPSVNKELWFTATSHREDLDRVAEIVGAATQSVQFLMFMPGTNGVLQSLLALRTEQPSLFLHGVVNSLSQSGRNGTVELLSGDDLNRFPYSVIEPEGIRESLTNWAAEITRHDFIGNQSNPNIGHAIVHSKVIVVDAFTDHPVVITGSHNFSDSASRKNDENLIVIRDNPALAQKYVVNIVSVYEHYRWRQFVNSRVASGQPIGEAQPRDDAWQATKQHDARQVALWKLMGLVGP